MPFYLDLCDRHYTNQKWLRRDFGGKLPSEVFLQQSLACFVTDPHAPERLEREFGAADCTPAEIDKMTRQNACRFYRWDPFTGVSKERASVGALRALATDVDTTIRSPPSGPSATGKSTPRSKTPVITGETARQRGIPG